MDLHEEYRDFATVIIQKICEDYMTAYFNYKKGPNSIERMDELMEQSRCFFTEWYRTITTLNAGYLIKRLKQKVNERIEDERIRRTESI